MNMQNTSILLAFPNFSKKIYGFTFFWICWISVTFGTVPSAPGPYPVTVHFIPPLVEAPCQFLQAWYPESIPCAVCFCLTTTYSRCFPQPGCDPNNSTLSTTTSRPGGTETTSSDGSEIIGVTEATTQPGSQPANEPTQPTSQASNSASSTPTTTATATPTAGRRSRSPRSFGKNKHGKTRF